MNNRSASLMCALPLSICSCDDPTFDSQSDPHSQSQTETTRESISVEGCRVYLEYYEGITIVQVVFLQSITETSYAKAAVRSAIDQAIAQMPDREIMAFAFDLDDNTIQGHVYGGELYYDPDTQRVMTYSEKYGYKFERENYGDYLVVVEERGTAKGITPARKWLNIKFAWPDPPTSNAARRVIERENGRYRSLGLDMNYYVHSGDFENPASWIHVKMQGKYMNAEYDTETRKLTPNWDW